MSRYIDADTAIDKVDCLFRDTERDKGNFMLTGYNHAVADCIAILKNLDGVEVVRCKECKYWDDNPPGSILGKCSFLLREQVTPKFFFCSDGERREVQRNLNTSNTLDALETEVTE